MLHVICNARPCADIISLPVSAFISPLNIHTNVSSSLTSHLSILLKYWPCITFLSHYFFKDSPNFAFVYSMPSFFVSLYSFDWFNSSTIFANLCLCLIVENTYGRLLSWLLTINCKLVFFMFCVQIFCFACHSNWQQASSSSFPFYMQPIYISFWVITHW